MSSPSLHLVWMNLKLSKRGDYVVRSAICLACAYESGALKKRHEVSAEMGVPRTFVSQILGDLVRAGLAVSAFGKDGGYRLARPPAEISLVEVVEAGEGPLIPGTCAIGDGPCRWEAVCPLHESWGAASASLRSELAATSLADVAERSRVIEAGTYPVPADAHRQAALWVPVADSVQVELAAQAVAARLRGGGAWLASHVEAASADGEATRLRVGPGGPAWLGKTVAVHLGEPNGTDDALTIPLTWEATGPTGLFPRLKAELHVSAVDPERAELALSGHYRPPLGRAGQVLDEALLTHVARATVRSLLRRVARALEEAPARRPTLGPAPVGPTRAGLATFEDSVAGEK
jgi:Rrf2 family protein